MYAGGGKHTTFFLLIFSDFTLACFKQLSKDDTRLSSNLRTSLLCVAAHVRTVLAVSTVVLAQSEGNINDLSFNILSTAAKNRPLPKKTKHRQ